MIDVDHVGVIFGGPGPEHDVSVLTGLQAERCLASNGVHVSSLYWSKDGDFYDVGLGLEGKDFGEGVPAGSSRLDLHLGAESGFFKLNRLRRPVRLGLVSVVNCCHGTPGECGRLQGLLDLAGVPYTGPAQASAALGMDKLTFAAVMNSVGVPSVTRVPLNSVQAGELGGPLVLKPRYGGSSIGVELVADLATATSLARSNSLYYAGAVVEPYLDGWYDVNIGIRNWPDQEVSAIERPLKSGMLLSYADKYVPTEGMAGAPRELPAELPHDLTREIQQYARTVAAVASVRGVARLDFMTDGKSVLVNELNTIPGSLGRYLWVEPHVSFFDLLSGMVNESLVNPAYRQVLSGADGHLLRSAASVAAKLA